MSKTPGKTKADAAREPVPDEHQVAPLRTPETARWTLLALTLLALVLLALIIRPFAAALFIAAVMAGAFYGWFTRLAQRLGGRRNLSAALSTLAIVLVVVLPVTLISVTVAREGSDAVDYVRRTLRSEGVEGLV